MSRPLIAAAVLLAVLPLSGCFGGGSDSFSFVPGTKFKETGNEVRLLARVLDYDAEVYPGLDAYLWAFCFAPANPDDTYSANAIEGWTPIGNDRAVQADGSALELRPGEKCSVPGPTLRVKQGDRVIVELVNNHFHPHTIHWHGQFVPYLSDGAPGVSQTPSHLGSSYTYDFIAKRAGTLWYHCHVDTQTHVMQGLYGMMIVEPQDKSLEPKGIDREYYVVLSTMNRGMVEASGKRHAHGAGCNSGFFDDGQGNPCENPASQAGQPDVFLLNGHSFPFTMDQLDAEDGSTKGSLMVVKPGERIRIRMLNAGETFEEVHLHGHDMQVVAQDGNPLSKSSRYWVDTVKIGPAQRFDVVMEADNPGPWMIHTHVSSHETNCAKAPGGMHTMLVYEEYLGEKMHEFKAELPVECPKSEILELPGDYHNSTSFSLNSPAVGDVVIPGPVQNGEQTLGTWTFPVDLPCAVRSLKFYATVWQPNAAFQASQATVTVDVPPPPGSKAESNQTVSTAAQPDSIVWEGHTLRGLTDIPGNYTVTVKGTGSDAKVDLSVHIDYYETFEQSKLGHLKYSVGGCPGYT